MPWGVPTSLQTLKWVAGGVWDEFQKRVTALDHFHLGVPGGWEMTGHLGSIAAI